VIDMEWTRMMRGATTLLEDLADVKEGEKVLIVTDTKLTEIGETIYAAAYAMKADPILCVITPRDSDGEEPPLPVSEAMKKSDVILTPVSKSITHTRAVKEATESGARILAMTGFTERLMISGGIEADFIAQKPVCESLAELFKNHEELKLTTPAGTNLIMSIKGRRGNALTCIVDKPGMFSPVPNIEANVSPVEGTTQGKIVVDASIPYIDLGLIKTPIKMNVEDGFITNIEGEDQANILRRDLESKDDPMVYNIAEIGVGLNPKSRLTGVMLDDEGVLGTCHIGIGTNITLGGNIQAQIHYDLVLWKPTITLDGIAAIKNGKIIF
jgi:leucyl aminopeptidase (aminopeptidase T)